MRTSIALAGVVTASFALAACGTDAPTAIESPAHSGRVASIAEQSTYIVVFRDDVADAPGKALALAKQHGGNVTHTYTAALKGFAGTFSEQAIAALARNPLVALIEADKALTVFGPKTAPTVPWGLDRIDQRAPLTSTGPYAYTYTSTGSGVTAYILDTGILPTHTQFGGRAIVGVDYIGDGKNGIDCNGHGTHVAGTIGGSTYGVAKAVKLVGVRVMNCNGSGTLSGVVAGVDWVAKNATKPAVANMSLGGDRDSVLNTAVANAIKAGVSFVVSAGNSAADACLYSPASLREAVTVGAVSIADERSQFSNYGDCVDVFAPGEGIISAWPFNWKGTIDNNGWANLNGTSMAAPHVAGVVAQYLQGHPSYTPAQVRDALVANATQGIVTNALSTNNHLLFTNY